tara:strand:- start:440 stop:1222 length:783 start_codon:yes stop_codon:yes gene_type:complete
MSSIYKKGRDGYYYYQTYVKNPETGKKDKRIFHSLGTKDENTAKNLQIKLDQKYSNVSSKFALIDYLITNKTKFLYISFLILGFIFLQKIFQQTDSRITSEFSTVNSTKSDLNNFTMDTITNAKDDKIIAEINDTFSLESEIKDNLDLPSVEELPKYIIQREEILPGVFNQVKLFLTLNSNSSRQELLGICNKIVIDYGNYSNIMICLYSNSKVGIKIAKGEDASLITERKENVWLAMYTYNSVEGAYFDDNPTAYLGAF